MPSRRHALQWLAGTAAAATASSSSTSAAPRETEPAPPDYPRRYSLHDPDFSKVAPYDFPWEKQLSEAELATAKVFGDLLLPADDTSPAASEVGVADFINEWVSAPYEQHHHDAQIIRSGLAWLNTEGFKRHQRAFTDLSEAQQIALIDSICDATTAKPEDAVGVAFFKTFRQLALSGYYTHSKTWKSLGYTGNISLAGPYPGAPRELIERLGLQDVA